jgi:O-acetyl-ADP-ribose deacetylase (regulator of RNase III)
MEVGINGTKLILVRGDITREETEAIVNAANSGLVGGGGVDGAIHRAGGPRIMEECAAIRARQGGCPTGEAVLTTGGALKANYVIHTVGPIWKGGNRNEPELLRNCYRNSLSLAEAQGIRTISFPSISTGVYGYPVEKAAEVALAAIIDYVSAHTGFDEVRMVLFHDRDYATYREALKKLQRHDSAFPERG